MRRTTQGNIQKNITLTPELFYALLGKAKEIKLDFQDYIRLLLASSVKTNLPLVDEETEQRIAKSLKEIKRGEYTDLESDQDIEKHFEKLLD